MGWNSENMRRESTGPTRRIAFLPLIGYSKSDMKASGVGVPALAALETAVNRAAGVECTLDMALAISSDTPGTCISCETQVTFTMLAVSRRSVWHRIPGTLNRDGALRFRLSAMDAAHCTTYSATWAASLSSTTAAPVRTRQDAMEAAEPASRLAGLFPEESSSSLEDAKGL